MTDNNLPPEDYAQAVKYLKLVLPEMHRLHIPATPNNYSVWYEYATGNNPSLSEKIDALKASRKYFSSELNENLYDLFIRHQEEPHLTKLNANVKSIIDTLLERMHKQESVHDSYSQSLESLSEEVIGIKNLADIEGLIQKLLAEAHLKNIENAAFQKQISEMSSEVKKLDKKLRRAALDANTDALTGIPNRRALSMKLRNLDKYKENFSLIMIDIDHFKLLNDTFGHVTGDRVLKFVAQLISKNIKGGDYLARYGGEEFILVLPNTSAENAECVANNIRRYLAKQKLYDRSEDKKIGKLTLSMGVAQRSSRESVEVALKRADACLYEAKNSGRNKVVCESSLVQEESA